MAICGKCGAELIGSAKFCAECGTPAAPPAAESAPRTVSDDSGTLARPPSTEVTMGTAPSSAFGANSALSPVASTAPPSRPDPFAATAFPESIAKARRQVSAPDATETMESPSAPPPPPNDASRVSPLAVSNGLSQRGAFQQVVESAFGTARSSATAAAAPTKMPGTQVMPVSPNQLFEPYAPSAPTVVAEPEAAPAKRVTPRTVAMSVGGRAPVAPLASAGSVGPTTTPTPGGKAPPPQSGMSPVPHAPPVPNAPPVPTGSGAWGRHPAGRGVHPLGQAMHPLGHAMHPLGHAMQPPAPAPYAYSFGYVPGSRVQVTWSNGQRYPATVSQVTGTRCLVVFPDGQQHWVDMQYLVPS